MSSSNLNLDDILQNLTKFKLPSEKEIYEIFSKSYDLFNNLPNLAELEPPLIIVGNIHGQFEDLLEIFKIGGEIPEINYLFLGNYVDRGIYGVETFLYLLILKIKYPKRITLLRGNHESSGISQTYGFFDECINKFKNLNIFNKFVEIFNLLQLAAVVKSSNKKYFCVHGGLSPLIDSLYDINNLNRKQDYFSEEAINDLLWDEPDNDTEYFSVPPKGCGYIFGKNEVEKFCKDNNVDFIVIGRMLSSEGFEYFFENKLINIWSAPNYVNICGNKACIIELDEHMNVNLKIFEAHKNINISNDLNKKDIKINEEEDK